MDICTSIQSRRSIRRFQTRCISPKVLKEILSLGRLYASAANLQPVRFGIISQKPHAERLFQMLSWAAYLPEYSVSSEQQPAAYIILCRDDSIKKDCQFEVGAAATTIMLAARGFGLDSCCLRSFQSKQVQQLMNLSDQYYPELVIALGYASENSEITELANSVHYYQVENGDMRVPKYSEDMVTIYSDLS